MTLTLNREVMHTAHLPTPRIFQTVPAIIQF